MLYKTQTPACFHADKMYPLANGSFASVVLGKGRYKGKICVDIRKYSVYQEKLVPGNGIAIPSSIWDDIISNLDKIEETLATKDLKQAYSVEYENGLLTTLLKIEYFHGENRLDIREHYRSAEGDLRPTTRGCNLTLEAFVELKKVLKTLKGDRTVFEVFVRE